MRVMPESITDEALEFAAQLVEEDSILDMAGIFARRKRQREDAELRANVRKEHRAELARRLRSLKSRPDLTPAAILRRIAEFVDNPAHQRHERHLTEAWPLAWMGWVDITASIRCNSNTIPPEVQYRITVTEKGRLALAAAEALT